MKGQLPLRFLGGFVLVGVSVLVGAGILMTSAGGSTPDLAEAIRSADYPICGDYRTGERVGERDFHRIVYARSIDKCESAANNVTLGFTLTRDDMDVFAREFGIVTEGGEPLVRYDPACDAPDFYGGVVVGADARVLFSEGDAVRIASTGSGVSVCPR